MDDMIYRNDPIAEENIDPHGRPATDEFEAKEREKRIREMDEIIKKDLKE